MFLCCSTRSSSVLWWIMHAASGGPLLTAMSGSYKCCNSSVFALHLTHLATLVTTSIWGFHSSRPHQSTNWEFRLKVSWCGEFLSSATWKALVLSEGCLMSPTVYRGGLMFSRPVEAAPKKAKSVQWVLSNTTRLPRLRFSVLFLSCKANSRV
jgi:hypothetical protein